MGNTQTQIDYPKGITFEQVWATLDRISKRQEETDRIIQENAKEAALARKEAARTMKEMDKKFGEFNNRFGEIVEHMVAPNLLIKFMDYGYVFLQANNNTKFSDFVNDIFFEVDIMLENGDKAVLVEVKTKLTNAYINDHIKRLEKMRKYADLHGDKRTFLGAAAGVVMRANTKEYALSKGLFVIEPSGEDFNITSPRGKPKEW